MPHTTTTPPSRSSLSLSDRQRKQSNVSVVSLHHTSVEVCYCVYGETPDAVDAVDRFYEPQALYENPLLTATTRSTIRDVFALSRRLGVLDIPRPLAILYRVLHLRPPTQADQALFGGLRVWTDIGDISDSESFDGHRKCVVVHSLNFLFFPGLHVDETPPTTAAASSSQSLVSSSPSTFSLRKHPSSPALLIPGTSLTVPSPFYFTLHVTSKLSFNEQGKVNHHRDYWDLKDVIGLVPGMSLAQWIGTRVTAKGLSYLSRSWFPSAHTAVAADMDTLETGGGGMSK